ncbi:hypothetical protein D3C85_801040 [compost metagenome]
MPMMAKISSALATAVVTITGRGMPKPGTSVSIRITAPTTKAAMPPKPITPKLGMKASAAMNRMPSRIRAMPAKFTGNSCRA